MCSALCRARAVTTELESGAVRVTQACQSKNLKVSFLEILLFSEQIAAALEFCASRGFVHMDVAARNALLHTNNLVKLSDFGIVRSASLLLCCFDGPSSRGMLC